MPQSKLTYSKTLDRTYLDKGDGSAVQVFGGDVRDLPGLFSTKELSGSEPSGTQLQGNRGSVEYGKQIGKDLLTDLVTQIPLATMGGGGITQVLKRMGVGGLAGGITDQLVNPDKPLSQTAGDVGANVALGELIPFLAEQGLPKIRIPGFERRKVSNTIHEATTGSSRNVGSSIREGISEGSGVSSREGKSTSSSSGQGNFKTETIRRNVDVAASHTPAMETLEKEIARLESIDTGKFNAGALKQVENAIAKNKAALDAMEDAGNSSYVITNTEGERSGSGISNTESSGTGKSSSRSASRGTASNTGERTSVTQPGASQTSSFETGSRSGPLGALMDIFNASGFDPATKKLNPLQRLLYGLGFNVGTDLTVNSPR